MPVGALPFAALLAFIDSIQDDRRNLEAVKEAVLILKKLLITPPRTVAADINIDALTGQQLLDKIMEGRDVLAALDQRNNTLSFKYPSWVFA
jgi:sulfur carrier protein ThiS